MIFEAKLGAPEGARILHPEGLDIRTFETEHATAEAGALYIMELVRRNPSAAITYATGKTMEPVYELIAQKKDRLGVDFSHTQVFHLDERYPCGPDDPSGFAFFIRERVVKPFAIPETQVHYWNGLAEDPDLEAVRYDTLLSKQSIDLVILGIGPPGKNGDRKGSHIAFNESGTPFNQGSHYVRRLSDETLDRDLIERGEKVPPGALTQGPPKIVGAKDILLIAYGTQKGIALGDALYGPTTEDCPASVLRLPGVKSKVHILIDQMAAAAMQAPRL